MSTTDTMNIWSVSGVAAADLSAKQDYAVVESTTGFDLAGGAVVIDGILQNDPALGQPAEVLKVGRCQAVVNGNSVNIAFGDPLKAASGGVLVKAATAEDIAVAIAKGAADADGVKIPVDLNGPWTIPT